MVKVKKSGEPKKLKIEIKKAISKSASSEGTIGRPLAIVIEAVKIMKENATRRNIIRYVARQYGAENEQLSKQLTTALVVACQSGLIHQKGSTFSPSKTRKVVRK